MELTHLALSHLSVSTANMRHAKKIPDVIDLIPSVRARGVLTPLLVRPGADVGHYEIVAGRRRYHAALAIARERSEDPMLPCAIMADDDDAAALEASIIENHAREDPDEVTLWISFTRLIKEGRSLAQIAATFGMEEMQVKRILALGNLLPRIRELYGKGEIDPASVRYLTMASRAKQTEWLALYRDPAAWAPTGQRLKDWLFGGQSVTTKFALFDLATYPDLIVTDLFGDDQYFSNADSFWTLQGEAIAKLRQGYIDGGWSDTITLEIGHHFQRWEYEKIAKKDGGKVYITVTRQGEVECYEGWLTTREARKRASIVQSGKTATTQRPERSSTLQAYLDLHRHAMVQTALVKQPAIALRLMVAHAIAGSWLWNVRPDPLRASNPATAESHGQCRARAAFKKAQAAVADLLGIDAGEDMITSSKSMDIAILFRHLCQLSDQDVLCVLSVVMAETLAVGSEIMDPVGIALAVDPVNYWQADDAFLSLVRQREVLGALVGEVAGEAVAVCNAHERAKTLRGILSDCLAGANGRTKVDQWVPRWMRFPAGSYFVLPADSAVSDDEDEIATGEAASKDNGHGDEDIFVAGHDELAE